MYNIIGENEAKCRRKFCFVINLEYLCSCLYILRIKSEKMKKIFLTLALLVSLSAGAQSLREAWISMPDSLLPVLDRNLRTELVELTDMGVKSEVNSLLGENCSMDTLTADFLQVTTSSASTLQLKLLPLSQGDSLVCMVKTFSAPEKESEIGFYSHDWKQLDSQEYLDSALMLEQCRPYFSSIPDTLSNVLVPETAVEPRMVYFQLFPGEESLVAGLSLPMLTKEEKERIQLLLLQRKFKWNGKNFNEN